MKKENEVKLINVIAKKQIGNASFAKKYGIHCSGGDELLRTYLEKDLDPPIEVLNESEKIYAAEFTEQIMKLLEKDMPEEFFRDLIIYTINS